MWEKRGRPTSGIAAGRGKGVIFRRGTIVRHVLEHEMVDALLEEARFLAAEAGRAVGTQHRRHGAALLWPRTGIHRAGALDESSRPVRKAAARGETR